jgi:hypothetical protein
MSYFIEMVEKKISGFGGIETMPKQASSSDIPISPLKIKNS